MKSLLKALAKSTASCELFWRYFGYRGGGLTSLFGEMTSLIRLSHLLLT